MQKAWILLKLKVQLRIHFLAHELPAPSYEKLSLLFINVLVINHQFC